MDEKLFNSKKVNPAWLKTHVVSLFSEIYDMINAKEHPTDEEMLIAAKIEWEWLRYDIPGDWLGIHRTRPRRIAFVEKSPGLRKRRVSFKTKYGHISFIKGRQIKVT